MHLKKIELLTIMLLIPCFVQFIMCPATHALTVSKCQQLLIVQQQFQKQKNDFHHPDHAVAHYLNLSFLPFHLHAYDTSIRLTRQPSADPTHSDKSTLLQSNRLNL